jgi:nucleoside-diphosphate-sugar epimerase
VPDGVEAEYGRRPDRALEHERIADVERTYDLIGWRASTSLEEGLGRTVEWYRREGTVTAGATR